MEAARLESGGVWRWVCGFFANPVTISRKERTATLLAHSYEVMTIPIST